MLANKQSEKKEKIKKNKKCSKKSRQMMSEKALRFDLWQKKKKNSKGINLEIGKTK